jgi:Cu+-exporting ATPase
MSIMVGMGRGARAGVLIREAEVLETLERATIVAFDKTGTLTEGRPRLIEIRASGGSEAELLRRVAALERHSSHPIARAIIAEAERSGAIPGDATDVQTVQGEGLRGQVDGRWILAGNRDFLSKAEVSGLPDESSEVGAWRDQGATIVWIAEAGAYAGRMVVADTIKSNGPLVIAALHHMGITTVMLTGDHASTAASIGRKLGIEKIEASLHPEHKIRRIHELRQPPAAGQDADPQSPVVVMVGDGINDAPALAAATVGVAMGTGSDIAIEAASVSLIGGDLAGVVRAVRLSRAVMRNIRQNLLFAFSYNIIGIPLAAGALVPIAGISLHPLFAATAMIFSSLCVISNALRLRHARLDAAVN